MQRRCGNEATQDSAEPVFPFGEAPDWNRPRRVIANFTLQLAESSLMGILRRQILQRIERLGHVVCSAARGSEDLNPNRKSRIEPFRVEISQAALDAERGTSRVLQHIDLADPQSSRRLR
jgi:hypothetical protein